MLLASASGQAVAQAPLALPSVPYDGQSRTAYSPADRISANLLAGGMSRLAAISAQQRDVAVFPVTLGSSFAEAVVNVRRMDAFLGQLPGRQLQGVMLSPATTQQYYRPVDLTPSFMRGLILAPAPQSSAFVSPVRPALARPAPRSGQPDIFGSVALPIGHTTLDGKWTSIAQPLAGKGLWSGIVRAAQTAGRQQQVEMINSWVNRRLRFVDDRQNGDSWAPASQSLNRGSGDCEDYAIAKMKLLEAAGFDRRAMFLVIARDLVRQADHAVLAVQLGDELMVLDNMTDRIMPSSSVSDYRPIMSFNAFGRWTHGYRVTTPQKVQFAAR